MILYRFIAKSMVLMMIAGLVGCNDPEPETLETQTIRPVRTITISPPSQTRERRFSGAAKAAKETQLSFRVSGKISELPARVGLNVKAGDLIAKLDPGDYQLQVEQTKAELARVEAGLKQAQSAYERTRKLYEVNNATKSDLDNALAEFSSARAMKDATARSLQLAHKQLDYTLLYAPVDGAVSAVPVEAFQTVQAGMTIAVLSSDEDIQMEIGVPDQMINLVRMGNPAVVSFEALPGQRFNARVSEIGVGLSASATYPVKLQLENPSPDIRPGMVGTASFHFEFSPEQQAVLVPPESVVGAPDGRHFVWVVDTDTMIVQRVPVTVGALTSDGLRIMSGLNPGDHLVIRGVHRVEEGTKVRLLNDPEVQP
jgi:RND family efflux transporter MFP subunit